MPAASVLRASLGAAAAVALAAPLLAAQAPEGAGPSRPVSRGTAPAAVVPNDNRVPGGHVEGGIVRLRLEARAAAWRPDPGVDSAVTVQAFAEAGGPPRIPGPLLRAPEGAEVSVSVRNLASDSVLVVHGLRAGTVADDTLYVAAGATREVRFRTGRPGTYLYWGRTTSDSVLETRSRRDAQLTGAIVVDPRGVRPDPAERIFVMTVIDIYPDSVRNPAKEDVWELAINGRAWPDTERLEYSVGDTVRWRWLNGSYLPHPMHLHGFHFRVLAKGDGASDTVYTEKSRRLAVTEFMVSGSTFRMDWVPTRAGRWLMHCHMIPHITPYPARPDTSRGHDLHDVARHPTSAMAGLVLGVTTVDPAGRREGAPQPSRRLRLFVQQAPADSGKPARHGYVLQRLAEPRADSVEVPGSPLVLTRGETTAISVVNRLREPTTVHWHGMELESVFDGVSGWSGTGTSLAPLLAPGDSFTVALTPPRAGTYIYHTHMDEGEQLGAGLYGPLLVLEPGERHDPATDLLFVMGSAVEEDSIRAALNGRSQPPPLELLAGTRYRLRFVNIQAAAAATVELVADSVPLAWRPLAKDGADLPDAQRTEGPARLGRFGVGETYDFEWTPERPVEAELRILTGEGATLRQPIRVRGAQTSADRRLHRHTDRLTGT
ncbi:MAG TPA: multicopper oxidase domain-containing protein [Longimicrobiaceae bacterium]|nr:multicopper oxidase domain-containing protein [Longimicrobiaceae bacterium]